MTNKPTFLPSARYVGPDSEIRTGEPEYKGGRIYPVDPEAHASLRKALGVPVGGRRAARESGDASAPRLAENLRRRRLERQSGVKPKRSMGRTAVDEHEMQALTVLVVDGATVAELDRWRREHRINGNTFKRLLREIRARKQVK